MIKLRYQVLRVLPFGVLVCGLLSTPAWGQFSQQGPKLVGADAVGEAVQGLSVSISADGNTALVGGDGDNGGLGAAWVYTRSGGVWSQQGSKLVGTGAVNSPYPAHQGEAVSISADGNTAIVGATVDNNFAGAAWVYTRSGGVWSQQGPKLVGAGAIGPDVEQGLSVALSSDGNTAIVGGPNDSPIVINGNSGGSVGAAWVFTRSGGVWSQQGPKLVGTGAIGGAGQGYSVSLSADGNTAIVGGFFDDNQLGAAWVFTRSGGVWSQQGPKLVGTGAIGNAFQGTASLSADGNTALIGGWGDNNYAGAAWVFTRSGGVWSQQGPKLVGTGAQGPRALQGYSVSLSGNGNIALVGGYGDDNNIGAAWVFTRSGGVWSQQGPKLVGAGAVGNATQGTSVSISGNASTAMVGGPGDNHFVGAVWVFAQPFAPASGTLCNGVYEGTFSGNITVSAGQNCEFINGGRVTGNVTMVGGNFVLNGAGVGGNLVINGGGTFTIGPAATIGVNLTIENIPPGSASNSVCGSTVLGNLTFYNNGTAVQIGSNAPLTCAGNEIGGSLTALDDTNSVLIFDNSVGVNATVNNNTGPVDVVGNKVSNNLQCLSNSMLIMGGSNTAGGRINRAM